MPYPRYLQRTRYFPPSTLNATEGRPLLKFGDSGPEVEDLQGALIAAGFVGANKDSPGQFGSSTLSALRSYQTAKRLAVTGDSTEQTWEALFPTRKGGGSVTMGPLDISGNTGLLLFGVVGAAALWVLIRMRSGRFSPGMAGLSRRRRARRQ